MMDLPFVVAGIVLAAIILWLWNKQRRLSALLKFGCVICILMTTVACEDDKFFSEVRPMIFVKQMSSAEILVENWFDNSTDRDLFLSDGYWPFSLNNTTIA